MVKPSLVAQLWVTMGLQFPEIWVGPSPGLLSDPFFGQRLPLMLSGQYCRLVLEPTQDKDADPQITSTFPYTTMRNQIRAKGSLGTANRESQMDKELQKVAGSGRSPSEPGFV